VHDDIVVTRHGDVEVLTIDRPAVRNALRLQTYDELERAVRSTTARCLVVTGTDPAFCSGDDVREVMGGGEREQPVVVTPRLTPAADALGCNPAGQLDRGGQRLVMRGRSPWPAQR